MSENTNKPKAHIMVTVKDKNGKWYRRVWKSTANRIDAIRWTIESPDVPHYLDVNSITEVTVTEED